MIENKLPFAKDASKHRPSMFSGANFGKFASKFSLNQLTKVFGMQL